MAAGRRHATKLWNLLPREGGRRKKGHRGPRSTASPAGSVGLPQRDAPLTLVQGRALLQSKPGPHHKVFRSPSSGSHAVTGCSGYRGQPAIVCRPSPRQEARDLRASLSMVHHVGCGRLPRPGKGLHRRKLGMIVVCFPLVPEGSKVSGVTPWL
ncbi:hypothetical protein NDU88_004043 [Pleurodeles waltl]|uniref:Uncharacterized protein n=1 Tax=Pleurodeles waltl TaxID=8319 RepID=A0AAV7M6E6_PLEWA|nr:hypothetical protein NDU88_004043 [Pleurodeles waltl]